MISYPNPVRLVTFTWIGGPSNDASYCTLENRWLSWTKEIHRKCALPFDNTLDLDLRYLSSVNNIIDAVNVIVVKKKHWTRMV
jgi:hypothetical protein